MSKDEIYYIKTNLSLYFSRENDTYFYQNKNKKNIKYNTTASVKAFVGIVFNSKSKQNVAGDLKMEDTFNMMTLVFDYVSFRDIKLSDDVMSNSQNLNSSNGESIDTSSTNFIDLTRTLGSSAIKSKGVYQADAPGIGKSGILFGDADTMSKIDGALRTMIIAQYNRGAIHLHFMTSNNNLFFNPSVFYSVNTLTPETAGKDANGRNILLDYSNNIYIKYPTKRSTIPYDSTSILNNKYLLFYTSSKTLVSSWNYSNIYAGFTHLMSNFPYQKSYALAYDDFGGGFAPVINANCKN